MHGLIFEIFEAWIVDDYGIEAWHDAKKTAGCDMKDNAFVTRELYNFDTLVDLVTAASILLHSPAEKILQDYGTYIVGYLFSKEYGALLRCQGSTLRQWLSHLNAMHDHFQKSFPDGDKFCPPVFWCGDCNLEEGCIMLNYFSHRGTIFVPMVVGIVEEIASYHFKVDIKMDRLALQDEDGSKFTTWRISALDKSQRWKLSPKVPNPNGEMAKECPMNFKDMNITKCPFTGKKLRDEKEEKKEEAASCPYSQSKSVEATLPQPSVAATAAEGISMERLREVFPFHVIVDRNFKILQVGMNLPQVLETTDKDLQGVHIQDVFKITRPDMAFSWDWQSMNSLCDQNFFVSPTMKGETSVQNVNFKASMLTLSKDKVMYSLCPHVNNLQHLNDIGLTLSDLSLVTSQRDAVFLGEYVSQESTKTNTLDKISKDLKSEQKLSNTLLYNMLPRQVADGLRMGKTVEPQFHKNVTLFFSDIEGFTNLCQQVRPWDVIDMVNQLYSVMDSLVDHFDLYKVETVGDSYMCCSGLPEPDEHHAEKIANFALAVVECSRHIKSPVTGESIKLRIGIHTGSCTSGVVGTLTPHYCLFGDMVNFTSRHESTGAAGKIHCSSDLFGHLKFLSKSKIQQFNFKARGLVDMKGKGEHYTYWLESATESNSAASAISLKTLSNEAKHIIISEKWKMRRYFQDDVIAISGDGSISNSMDNIECKSVHSSYCSIGSALNELGTLGDLSENGDTLVEYAAELLSKKTSEWQNLKIDDYATADELQSSVFVLLFSALNECLDKGGKRLEIVEKQLHSFVKAVGQEYNCNSAAHNFRAAAESSLRAAFLWNRRNDHQFHDPWDRFVLLFSTLIHNMDHTGVTNCQLETEGHSFVQQYKRKGAYQQRSSFHSAMEILEDDFAHLYDEIVFGCPTFRQSVKKLVLLLADMESEAKCKEMISSLTLVIMQNGDGRLAKESSEAVSGITFILATVGHYCQSYELFLRGNQVLFHSEVRAFNGGRSQADPRDSWHFKQSMVFQESIMPILDCIKLVLPTEVYLQHGALNNMSLWAKNGQESLAASLLPGAQVENRNDAERLISKNVSMLESLLKEVAARHALDAPIADLQDSFETNGTPYGELQLTVEMHAAESSNQSRSLSSFDLPPDVQAELRKYVVAISAGYENHAFHNFQHASHVAHLSNLLVHSMDGSNAGATGIVHDPFVRFAIVFSALVHDVGHAGVPNKRLVEENHVLAAKYSEKSIAEQNSIDTAWDILMLKPFKNLRHCIFGKSGANQKRFRQLLVNSVMATDIFEQDLRVLRELRLERSLSCENCKATLVMEHLMQTADVVHTMQNWDIYLDWNQSLFSEMHTAFLDGRADSDPSESWYQGELWFFDNWVLPLAQRLKDIGVLNIISDQLFRQAQRNRSRWEREGQGICQSLLASTMEAGVRESTVLCASSDGTSLTDATTRAESVLMSSIVEEIESLTKVMKRYERKLDSACGNLLAVTYKCELDPEFKKQSLEKFRQKDWYQHVHQKSIDSDDEDIFDEMSAVTFGSQSKPLRQLLLKEDQIVNNPRAWAAESTPGIS